MVLSHCSDLIPQLTQRTVKKKKWNVLHYPASHAICTVIKHIKSALARKITLQCISILLLDMCITWYQRLTVMYWQMFFSMFIISIYTLCDHPKNIPF